MSTPYYSTDGLNDLLNDLTSISAFLTSSTDSLRPETLSMLLEDHYDLVQEINTYYLVLIRNGFRPVMS